MVMERISGVHKLTRTFDRAVVAIGNFDGVHVGHREILALAVERAKKNSGTSIAYTFRPHPQIALHPERALPLLSTDDERAHLIESTGIQVLIEEPFSRSLSVTTAETFFNDFLLGILKPAEIVVGYDFGFGKGRGGNLDELKRLCTQAGVRLEVVTAQKGKSDEVVSSSKIRACLQAHEIEKANQLLGKKFSYRGVVEKGDQRGRKIGFPTANLKLPANKIVLPLGVYSTEVTAFRSEQVLGRYLGVSNLGVRPTFQSVPPEPVLETHILDLPQSDTPEKVLDLYGISLEISFVGFIRNEKKFAGLDQLVEQIQQDILVARKQLSSSTP